jgi:CheY-like chemotaxis protein
MADAQVARRVLVVDDDPALIASLSDGLRLLGHFEVAVASDGASGLERYFAVRPDCLVVDVRMPGLNGYQLIRALRGDPLTAQTPIVVLSALARDRDQIAGMLSGADAYLTKPVRIAELVRAIEAAITLSAEQRFARRVDISDERAEYPAD